MQWIAKHLLGEARRSLSENTSQRNSDGLLSAVSGLSSHAKGALWTLGRPQSIEWSRNRRSA
jgi:hypothetical protein